VPSVDLLQKGVDRRGELLTLLEKKGVAAVEEGQPGERNLAGW
jgi:hypothetical protein